MPICLRRTAAAGLLVVLASSGCTMLEGAREMTRQTLRTFKLDPTGYRDMTEEEREDPWAEVGVEARGNQPITHDPDQWWRNSFMSAKARRIERNLGVE